MSPCLEHAPLMRFSASRKRLRGAVGWGTLMPHDDRASARRASGAGFARPRSCRASWRSAARRLDRGAR